MRLLPQLNLVLILLAVVLLVNPVEAQERSSTGRHKPALAVVEEEDEHLSADSDIGSWSIELNGGLIGGSDLFDARHSLEDSTIVWVPGAEEEWASQRIRVGLENSFAMGFQIQRRMGNWYSLRAGATYSRMDMSADAPMGESAEVFFYDQADVWLFNVGAEVRLTILTPSYPYLTMDLAYVDFSPIRSDFLSQGNLGGRLALGYHHQFDSVWAFNIETGISRTALSSIFFTAPEGTDSENIEYENETHLSLFEVKFGIRVKI